MDLRVSDAGLVLIRDLRPQKGIFWTLRDQRRFADPGQEISLNDVEPYASAASDFVSLNRMLPSVVAGTYVNTKITRMLDAGPALAYHQIDYFLSEGRATRLRGCFACQMMPHGIGCFGALR